MTEEIIQQDGRSPKLNIIMDVSQYDTFRMCERKYYYRYLLNLHPLTNAAPLDRGTLVHLAAEIYYEQIKHGVQYEDARIKALSAIRSAGIETDLEVDDILRVIDVMEEYFDHWRVADQNLHIGEVEKSFLYLLHETELWRFFFSGKIDLTYSDNQYTNMPMDHKSYDRQYNTTRMSNQFCNYVNALESSFLVVNKIGFQKTLKPHEKFIRVPLSYDPIYLEQWKRNVIFVIDHLVECHANNYWPKNETSCDKFNRKCEYYDVCDSSGEEAATFKLQVNFMKKDPWDVTKALAKTSETIQERKKEAGTEIK